MKILFVCENYLPHYGGAEVVFKNLAEGFVKNGHEVTLVTCRIEGTSKSEIISGVKVYRVSCFDSRYLFSFLSIPKVLKLAKMADIIQTTTFNGAPPAWLAGKLLGKPVVLTVHEVWINKWNKVTDFGRIKCFIHNILEKIIYLLKFSRYICVSEATAADLRKTDVPQDRIMAIYNGFDYVFWNPENFDGKKVRKNLGLEKKFVYISWGRPGPSKGFEYLLRAVPEISPKIPDSILLLLLGSTSQYQQGYHRLMQLIRDLGIRDKVRVILSPPYNELGNYIKSADCVVIPSIAEGFGYSTLEGCTMGKPVVASNVGSIPEVIGGKYLLFEPKNHHQLAEKMVEMHRHKVAAKPTKKFTWEKAIGSYLNEYDKLVHRITKIKY